VTYWCEECETDVTLGLGYLISATPDDMDRAFQEEYGGVVIGQVPEPPNPQAENAKLRELVRLLADPFAASDRITDLRKELGL